jgi:hypothetical protein
MRGEEGRRGRGRGKEEGEGGGGKEEETAKVNDIVKDYPAWWWFIFSR